MCRRPAPPLLPQTNGPRRHPAAAFAAVHRAGRDRPRHRLHRRRRAGAAALERRVLVAGRRAVDARPSQPHRSRPLQLHRGASPLGDRRVGLRGRAGLAVPGLRRRSPSPSTASCWEASACWRARRTRAPSARAVAASWSSSCCCRSASPGPWWGDRGLDFSLVWFPLELLVLAKARANPRWLFALPPLCVAWVNTHGSILLGLFVIGLELLWSLIPARRVAQVHGTGQSPHTRPLVLALIGSVLASCLTPYGPGLLVYDIGVSRQRADRQVHQRMELTGFPFAGCAGRLPRPAGCPDRVRLAAAPARARGVAGRRLLHRGAADPAPRRVLDAGDASAWRRRSRLGPHGTPPRVAGPARAWRSSAS